MDSRMERGSEQKQHKALSLVWNHMFNFIHTLSVKCALQLSIPDALRDHPMTLPDLAAALRINPSKTPQLRRLMRFLTLSGFFALREQGYYALTDVSRLLLKDVGDDDPYSVAPLLLAFLDPRLTRPWDHFPAWFRNDDLSPFATAHGSPFWEYAPRHPEFGAVLNYGFASDTMIVARVVVEDHKEVFEGVKTLVDVGGNSGTMARGIADAFPGMECVVFDRPGVVEGLEGTKNLKFVGGDMFESIPPADAILLKWIMTDWIDEECVKILENCKKAITNNGREGGKVIIIEMVLENNSSQDNNELLKAQLFMDMEMLAFFNGKERDEPEWANLFSRAGFSNYKITPMEIRSLIELYP